MKKAIISLVTMMLIGIFSFPVVARASSEDEVLAQINAYRSSEGLCELSMNTDLCTVASVRAAECSERFSHTRPNGQAWFTVSDLTKGENLAHAENDTQQKPENVVLAWMLSPKHNANVLRPTYSSAGIAYYEGENGEIYIACEFK